MPKFLTRSGDFSNTCPQYTISPDDFIFFNFDRKYQKWDLATTWLGVKMCIRHMVVCGTSGVSKQCPPPCTPEGCLTPSWLVVSPCLPPTTNAQVVLPRILLSWPSHNPPPLISDHPQYLKVPSPLSSTGHLTSEHPGSPSARHDLSLVDSPLSSPFPLNFPSFEPPTR